MVAVAGYQSEAELAELVQRWDQTGMLMPQLIYHGNEQFMTRKAISRSSAAGSFLVFRLEWMQLHFCSPCCHNGAEKVGDLGALLLCWTQKDHPCNNVEICIGVVCPGLEGVPSCLTVACSWGFWFKRLAVVGDPTADDFPATVTSPENGNFAKLLDALPGVQIGDWSDDRRSDFDRFPEIATQQGERSEYQTEAIARSHQNLDKGERGIQRDSGQDSGLNGPSEAALAQLADEIILEAAMGHIEQLAELVMNEDIGPGPGIAAGLDMEDHTPIKNTSHLNGIAQNSVVRRRKKEKGFNMSPTLQVVGLDFDYDSDSEQGEEKGLNEWIENLKRKKGYEKEFCKMIDEAQQDVIKFFDKALKESGRPSVNWVHKATSYMLRKIEEYGNKKKVRVEPVKIGKWVDLLKEEVGMGLIMEALREIKSYMSVVYDSNQQIHLEDKNEMAKKACIILREIMRTSQKGDVLGSETDLGRQLHGHIEFLGGKICRWAWRRFGPGYPNKE
nr:hypothetical protein Iba_chr03aCG21270 [Ipomoea batatas]